MKGKILFCSMLYIHFSSAFVDKLLQRSSGLVDRLLQIKTCGHPRISNLMENITVKPGDKAIFNCKVDMSCMVSTINWYHEMENGTEVLIKTASDKGEPNVHIIRRVSSSDTGLYTCVAKNVLGRTHAAAYLAVNSAPFKHRPDYNWIGTALLFSSIIAR
ncbi:protein turtle homolog B isoform X2 [Eurytemora carolleeae]|uniref:protein turtle homolog B isoform X2 n=1 Tax=Eurytemora carolleeae TaxID=1294199 RepID=UPI000C77A823|nr:protein turtle homolog B isoform X2 [Eurytemora carolleeae]|eukprot:XP_023321266.1 protein turtle homolog B-like isoform X2 [Eurytemora affinis]